MNGPRINPARRSRLYDRYNVNIKSSSRGRRSRRVLFSSKGSDDGNSDDDDNSTTSIQWMQQRNNRLLLMVAAIILLALSIGISKPSAQKSVVQKTSSNVGGRLVDNSYSTVSQKIRQHTQHKQQQEEQQQGDIDEESITPVRKRWNPCLNSRYELERHDHEPRHGDVCRANDGLMGVYECPEGCHETAGNPPYCANDKMGKNTALTIGNRGGPCRVRDPDAPPEYRCDDGACIIAVGDKEQFKGEGVYMDETCNNKCGDGRKGQLTPWIVQGGKCTSDIDCSLSGVCTPEGKCQCDDWAEGVDCSYLKFQPVDKSRLGYLHEQHSSWGGSIVQNSYGEYHMFVSEIICKEDYGTRKRCGLNNWETHSRVAHLTSSNIDGPYRRLEPSPVILHPEHHNPSIHKSPTTGDWHLFTISGPSGPIERMISSDEGKTWGVPATISPRQNPGPLLKEDGSTYLFYRADGLDLPSPTCSDEGIALQHCPSDKECNPPNDILLFDHTVSSPLQHFASSNI